MKYNEFGEVISVNGITTGQHLGTPMQDAIGTPEENSSYGVELSTVTRVGNTIDDLQPKTSTGGGIIDVDELPTENINENAFYRVPQKGYTNIECWIKLSGGGQTPYTLAQILSDGETTTPNITYYFVESKPNNPIISDFGTFDPVAVYIIDDIPQVYGDIGYGNAWYTVTEMMSNSGLDIPSRGRTFDIEAETEAGVYVSYDTTSSLGSAYTIFNNQKGEMYVNTTQVIIVDNLPNEGIPYLENSLVTIYLQLSDNTAYIYYENEWQSYAELGGDSFGGVISDESEAVDTTKLYIVYSEGGYQYYHYENGWVEYVAKK